MIRQMLADMPATVTEEVEVPGYCIGRIIGMCPCPCHRQLSSVRLSLGPLPWLCHQFVSVSFSSAVSSVHLCLVLFLGCVISLCPCPFHRQYHQYTCVWVLFLGCVISMCMSSLLVVSSVCVCLLRGCVINMCLSSPWLSSVRVCIFLTMSPVCVCVFSFAYCRVILCLGPVLFFRPWW